MGSAKVIITNQTELTEKYILENEIGLSTYDLALISINKIIHKSKPFMNDTY